MVVQQDLRRCRSGPAKTSAMNVRCHLRCELIDEPRASTPEASQRYHSSLDWSRSTFHLGVSLTNSRWFRSSAHGQPRYQAETLLTRLGSCNPPPRVSSHQPQLTQLPARDAILDLSRATIPVGVKLITSRWCSLAHGRQRCQAETSPTRLCFCTTASLFQLGSGWTRASIHVGLSNI